MLFISRIGFVETQSALAAKVRNGQLTEDDYELARKRFLGDVKSRRILVVRVLAKHYHLSGRLIVDHATLRRLRTLDALQLSIGLDLLEQNRIEQFACTDQALCNVATLENISVLNPLAAS